MAMRLLALRAGRPLPRRRFLVLISFSGWVDPGAIVRLERKYRPCVDWEIQEQFADNRSFVNRPPCICGGGGVHKAQYSPSKMPTWWGEWPWQLSIVPRHYALTSAGEKWTLLAQSRFEVLDATCGGEEGRGSHIKQNLPRPQTLCL
jgi:hypothetical protein